jgi:ATP-binding cassette subfamily B protein
VTAEGPDRSFAALGSLVKRYRWRFGGATAVRAFASALMGLHPYFIAQIATSADDPDRAFLYIALLFGTGMTHSVLWSACDFYVAGRINPISYEFKRMAFDTVWAEDYQRFVDRPSGKTASYVNDLRQNVNLLWDIAHYGFLPTLATIPVYIVLLWQATLATAFVYGAFLIVAFGLLAALSKPVNGRQRRLTDTTSTNNGRVFDSYANFVNVFSFRSHRKEIARNDDQLDGMIDDDISFGYALSAYWALASLLIRGVLWAIILGFSWYQFDRGNITFAAMLVSITVLIDFTNNYWEVVHFLGEWIDKSAKYREAYNYLFPGRDIVAEAARHDTVAEKASGPGQAVAVNGSSPPAAAPPALHSALEVRNLSFSYPDAPDITVLHDVSFTLDRGTKLGVVGRSGEGKSTLIKILLGFYQPTGGQILLDGVEVGPEELSRLHSYVPQDTSLFQESIAYNIGYAVDGAPDEQAVHHAAEQAKVADFIESLPERYDTMVGERGVKLSLGQRQRIALARAFLKRSDLIILDEATSALDSETEARIQDALVELWADKAAIIIAHRLATLNDVDHIIVIDKGRIVEQGPKEALLAEPGLFADLWGLQQSGLVDPPNRL